MEPEGSNRVYKSPPPVPILSQINPVHVPPPPISWRSILMLSFRVPFPSLRWYQRINPSPKHTYLFRNKTSFYSEELLAPRLTPKLEDHPLSAVRDWFFNIFTATLHIGAHYSIRNLRTRQAVVIGTHLSWGILMFFMVCSKDYEGKVPVHAMKVYEETEEWLYSFLTSALDECEWSDSLPGPYTSLRKSPRYSLNRRVGGPLNRSGRSFEKKNIFLLPGIEPQLLRSCPKSKSPD